MKKILLLLLSVFLLDVNSQCPVTVNGQPTGASFTICNGQTMTFTANGATLTYLWSGPSLNGTTGSVVTANPTSTSSYTVIGNSGGCQDTNIFILNVNPTPTVAVTTSSNTICAGGSSTLSLTGASTYTWVPGNFNGPNMVVNPGTTTCYTITGANFFGCMSSTVACVVVNSSPAVSFSMTNVSPLVWNVLANYTGGQAPYTYSWNWGDGSPNDVVAYPSHTYSVAGWYNICVSITDANGCIGNFCQNDSVYRMSATNSMITVNVVSGTTGMAQHFNNTAVFFPNPASDLVVIEDGFNSVELFDISGKMVLSRKLNGRTSLNISFLPEGMYFLSLQSGNTALRKRLIIAR